MIGSIAACCLQFPLVYIQQDDFNLLTKVHDAIKSRKNCAYNTPFSQPAMQQNVALPVAGKVELSSTYRNVARQVAARNMRIRNRPAELR